MTQQQLWCVASISPTYAPRLAAAADRDWGPNTAWRPFYWTQTYHRRERRPIPVRRAVLPGYVLLKPPSSRISDDRLVAMAGGAWVSVLRDGDGQPLLVSVADEIELARIEADDTPLAEVPVVFRFAANTIHVIKRGLLTGLEVTCLGKLKNKSTYGKFMLYDKPAELPLDLFEEVV